MPLYQVQGGTPYKKSTIGGLSQLFGSYAQGQQAREERLRQQQMQDLQMRLLRRQMGQIGQPRPVHPEQLDVWRGQAAAYGRQGQPQAPTQEDIINRITSIQKAVSAGEMHPEVGKRLIESQYPQMGRWLGGPYDLAQFAKPKAELNTATIDWGGKKYVIDTQTGQIIQELGPVTPAEYKPEIIENVETGEQRYVKPGEKIPMGWKARPLKPTVSVSVGERTSLEKSVKGVVEKEIKTIEDTLALVSRVADITKDEYLTYGGRIAAGATRFGEKLGIAKELKGIPIVGGAIDSDFLKDYSVWLMNAQEIYLKKRHEITGVAANPAEKEEIALAIPDPIKNSPSEFKAKTEELIRLLTQARNRLIIFRALGIPNPTKEQLSRISLGQVPLDPEEAAKQAPHIMLGATQSIPPPPPGAILD